MESRQEETFIYDGFFVSVALKGLISLGEVATGFAAFFVPPATIVSLAVLLLNYLPIHVLQNELLIEVARYTSDTVGFVALYLLSRGLIKVVLIFALLKNWLWAYPASLIVLALFLAYQAYQVLAAHSLIVLAISVFDLIVMYFIYREWRIVRAHNGVRNA